jgi:hypothetical protein
MKQISIIFLKKCNLKLVNSNKKRIINNRIVKQLNKIKNHKIIKMYLNYQITVWIIEVKKYIQSKIWRKTIKMQYLVQNGGNYLIVDVILLEKFNSGMEHHLYSLICIPVTIWERITLLNWILNFIEIRTEHLLYFQQYTYLLKVY